MCKIRDGFCKSTATDRLWWGDEAATKCRDLQAKEKELRNRIRNEKDVEASRIHSFYLKELLIISAVVEAGNRHGVGSNDFKTVYDLQMSSMQLAPEVKWAMPSHLSAARHSIDIAHTEQTERWHDRVSSEALVNAGISRIEEEQSKLFAERMSVALRISDESKREKQMSELFSPDIEYDLEARVGEFVSSLTMMLSCRQFPDLDERKELLEEATETMSRHLPSPTGEGGTVLGSTLLMHRTGQLIVETAKNELCLVTETLKILVPATKMLKDYVEIDNGASPTLRQQLETLNRASDALTKHHQKLDSVDDNTVLAEHMLHPRHASVSSACSRHMDMLLSLFVEVMMPIQVAASSLTQERLKQWSRATTILRAELSKHFTVIGAATCLMDFESPRYTNIQKAVALMNLLCTSAEVVGTTVEESVMKDLQRSLQTVRSGIEQISCEHFRKCVQELLASQFFTVIYHEWMKNILHMTGSKEVASYREWALKLK